MNLHQSLDTWFSITSLSLATQRRYRYEIAMFVRHGGTLDTNINASDLDAWRTRAATGGLSARTIESIVSSIRTLCRNAGNHLPVGRKLRFVRNVKATPSFADFTSVIDSASWWAGHSAEWWKRWLCWAYCTGLRRGDLLRMNRRMIADGCVQLVAAKTGKIQTIPLPEKMEIGDGDFLHVGIKQLRHGLRVFCNRAKVSPFTPQAIRRLSAKEWERAHAGCGAVILGHAIPGWSAATPSYLDGSDLLRLGLPRLRLPAMIADEERISREKEIVALASALPDHDQTTAVSVLRAMAR